MARNTGERPSVWVASLLSQTMAVAGLRGGSPAFLLQSELFSWLVSVAFLCSGQPPAERWHSRRPGI